MEPAYASRGQFRPLKRNANLSLVSCQHINELIIEGFAVVGINQRKFCERLNSDRKARTVNRPTKKGRPIGRPFLFLWGGATLSL
jgi:hypothetical protein